MSEPSGAVIEELVRASPDALVVVDDDGIIELATPAVSALFGYDPPELIGRPVDALVPGGLHEAHRDHREGFSPRLEARPMGVPLSLRAIRRDGSEFPAEVCLVPAGVGGRRRIGAFVRDATLRRRDEDLLRFVNEISRMTIEGWGTDELLNRVAARCRTLIGATVSWVGVIDPAADRLVVTAGDGPDTGRLVGSTVPASTSLAARVMEHGRPLAFADMSEALVLAEAQVIGVGPGIFLPMMAEAGPVGVLVLGRPAGAPGFDDAEVSAGEVFASAAAIVLALGSSRRSVDEARMTSEHERIARELHDTVIQRLFALGMRLQTAEKQAKGTVAERIRETVDSIDDVIREIRETIFDLNRSGEHEMGLRQQVCDVADEAAGHLGFAPRVAFHGPVETAVDPESAAHLQSVLREALANVGRHARASRVDAVVAATDSAITLTVADDGVGMGEGPTAGHGLRNMRTRAEKLGGELRLERNLPDGTLLTWSVPRR